MSRFFSPKFSDLTPYVPGEQPQDQQYTKLNTNESPFPPSPKVIEAMRDAGAKANLYNDPTCRALCEAIAGVYGVAPTRVHPVNGSDEILNFAIMAFCDEDHPLAYADITYGCYPVFAEFNRVPSHIIPLNEDFTVDYKAYCGLNETIVIANPNAPTGMVMPKWQIEEILRTNPDNVVIIDEAYVAFGAESCVDLVDKYDNLLVAHTFSKSHSLAASASRRSRSLQTSTPLNIPRTPTTSTAWRRPPVLPLWRTTIITSPTAASYSKTAPIPPPRLRQWALRCCRPLQTSSLRNRIGWRAARSMKSSSAEACWYATSIKKESRIISAFPSARWSRWRFS